MKRIQRFRLRFSLSQQKEDFEGLRCSSMLFSVSESINGLDVHMWYYCSAVLNAVGQPYQGCLPQKHHPRLGSIPPHNH